MKKITRQKDYMRLAAATAVTLLLGGEAAALTCTAAPDCADLGYTKTSCPKGGIKCPFDKNKMFCIREGGASDYKFVNAISRYQIAYSDGTTNKYYNTDKTAIGIITYVHQNKDRKHGIMMSLPAFTIQNQDEARKICAAYTTAGTMPGDWHLPDLAELTTMSAGDEKETNNDYTMFRDVLKTIPTAGDLEWSFSFFYENSIGSLNNGIDKKDTANTQGNWGGHTFYDGGNTNWYTSPAFLSASHYSTSDNVFYSSVNYHSGLAAVANNKKMQFRCVAEF